MYKAPLPALSLLWQTFKLNKSELKVYLFSSPRRESGIIFNQMIRISTSYELFSKKYIKTCLQKVEQTNNYL